LVSTIEDWIFFSSNKAAEEELKLRVVCGSVENATVSDFLSLKPASKLKNFFHARMFNGKTYHESKLVGADGKLNKTRYKSQTASSIESNCSDEDELCLVWLAWKLQSSAIVLQELPNPKPKQMPEFSFCMLSRLSLNQLQNIFETSRGLIVLRQQYVEFVLLQ
jgi:hypothetical protein